MDIGNLNIAVFVDLKKAFDTVDHTILLNKLQYYGFMSDELNWNLLEVKMLYKWGPFKYRYNEMWCTS